MLPQRTKVVRTTTDAERYPAGRVESPTLKLTRNGTVIQQIRFDQPQILIGRARDNDISIPTRYVSNHHILLIRQGASTVLVDLNSTNGTFVNSKRVHKHVLAHNDVITVDQRSMFVSYRIRYSEPSAIVRIASDDVESVDPEIEKLVAKFEKLAVGGDTDLCPELSEDVATVVGFVDDR